MIIYKITNRIDGKIYIGQTKRSIEKRWREHCRSDSQCVRMHKAIEKYGKENFTVTQIDSAIDQEEANAKEIYWISFFDSANKEKGYNLTYGGAIGNFNDEVRKKMSQDRTGEKNNFFGKHHTVEMRKVMSEKKKGIYEGSNHPKARKVRCVDTEEVFDTIKEAEQRFNISHGKITTVCQHRYGRKTAGGKRWEYA